MKGPQVGRPAYCRGALARASRVKTSWPGVAEWLSAAAAGGGGAGVLELTEQLGGLGLSLPGVTACTAQHDSAVGLIYDPVMEHHVADEGRRLPDASAMPLSSTLAWCCGIRSSLCTP